MSSLTIGSHFTITRLWTMSFLLNSRDAFGYMDRQIAHIDDLLPEFHPFNQKEPEISARYNDWQQPRKNADIVAQNNDYRFKVANDLYQMEDQADLYDLGAFNGSYGDEWSDAIRLEYDSFWDKVMEDDERVWVVAFIDPEDLACQEFSSQWEKLRTYQTLASRQVQFAYVDISSQINRDVIIQNFTNRLWERQPMESPSILIYGREKDEPVSYTGKKLAYHLNRYITNFCNDYGYKVQSTFAPKM